MIWVGIDTGVNTGMAVWDSKKRELLSLDTVTIDEAIFRVLGLVAEYQDITVIVEDARQRKWVPNTHDIRKEMSRRLGAGSIKRDAKIWEDFLTRMKIPFQMVAPCKGITKWSAGMFESITGCTLRSSEHSRDAAMLVFGRV